MMWYDGGGMHWWGWLLGAFMMVAFWGLIIWGIWFLVTSLTRHGDRPALGGAASGPGAKEILDVRLARGEIDTEEYRRLRGLMDSSSSPERSDAQKAGTASS